MNIFFIGIPDQKFFLFQSLLVCIHSCSSPHSIWTIPWLDWKTLLMKLHTEPFIGAKFDNDLWKLLQAQNLATTWIFFYRQPRPKTIVFQNILVCIHYYSSPHSMSTSLWFDWKTLFVKLPIETFIGDKIWQRHEYSFRRQPRSKIPCVSEPTSMHTLLLQPSFHLNKSFTLKNTFRELAYRAFYRRIFWQWLLRLLQAQNWQQHEYFLYRQPRSKTILFQNLLVCIHPYSRPQSIWTSPWFHWKTLFVKLHIETFIGDKIWQRHEYSFRRQPRSKIPFVSEPAWLHTLLL